MRQVETRPGRPWNSSGVGRVVLLGNAEGTPGIQSLRRTKIVLSGIFMLTKHLVSTENILFEKYMIFS